jgi:hypothetical protein
MHVGRAGTFRHRVWFTAANNASFSELEAFRNRAAPAKRLSAPLDATRCA